MVLYKVCIEYRKGIMYFRKYSIGTVNMYLLMYVLSVNVRCPTSDAQLCQASIAVS